MMHDSNYSITIAVHSKKTLHALYLYNYVILTYSVPAYNYNFIQGSDIDQTNMQPFWRCYHRYHIIVLLQLLVQVSH